MATLKILLFIKLIINNGHTNILFSLNYFNKLQRHSLNQFINKKRDAYENDVVTNDVYFKHHLTSTVYTFYHLLLKTDHKVRCYGHFFIRLTARLA